MSQNPQQSPAKRLGRAELKVRALELTVAGYSTRKVGAELGVSPQTISNWTRAELQRYAELHRQETELLRAQEGQRLDELQAAVWPAALEGRTAAVEAALGIMSRRARLMGLDKPVKVDLSGELDFHIGQLLSVLERVLPPEHYRTALEALSEAA